jgi:macrolide transport system ATP-binding/permease protein
MNTLFNDVRFGFRMLCKNPGFTTVALLVLTFAIGGTAAMFTIIDALVFRPLPVKEPQQLVRLFGKEKKPQGAYRGFSYPNYVDLRTRNEVFTDLFAFAEVLVGVNEGETTRRSFSTVASANYFDGFGVKLQAGRSFLPEEERPGSAIQTVIVSHTYWKRNGSDPALVGKTIRINSRTFQVVGIGPEYFTGTTAIFCFEFWFPLGMYEVLANDFANEGRHTLDDRKHHCLRLVGRLKPGINQASAETQLAGIAAQLESAYPEANEKYTIQLGKLARLSTNTYPQPDPSSAVLSILVMGMSGAVLLIACLNLANMLLARSAARQREIAVRLSLGAGRFRLIRQLLTEGLLLAVLGGAGGLLLSVWASKMLVTSLAPKLPFITLVFDPRPDWRILLITFGACLVSVLLFGLGPAWRLSRVNVTGALKEQVGDELHGKASRSIFAPRSLLVIGQLALSLALLTAAALFAHGASKALKATPGFSLDGGILVETDASMEGLDEARGRQIYIRLIEQLRTIPGVKSASLAYTVPFGLFSDERTVQQAGSPANNANSQKSKGDEKVHATYNIVAADYFKTLGLPLLQGREFDPVEISSASAPRVAIVDEILAKRLWPKQAALGQRIRFDEKEDTMEVVGMVPSVRDNMNDKALNPHVYVPFGQDYRSGINLHLTMAAEKAGGAEILKTVRDTIRSVDPQLAVVSIQSLRSFHEDGIMVWFVKTGARVCATFGGLALFLAVVGIYGVKAYIVTRRTREIGIRMALGATRENVLWMVLKEGLGMTAAGLALGLLLALAVGFGLRTMLYEVEALDPFAFTVAPLVLCAAAMLACYLPARRATRIQPMAALRCE